MDRGRTARVRLFLGLGGAMVVLSVAFLVVVYRSVDGTLFLHFLTLPALAFGGGLIGAGVADRETDGTRRPLRVGLALVCGTVGWTLFPVVSATMLGLDVLASIEQIAWVGVVLTVIGVVGVEVLVWESRGRPR